MLAALEEVMLRVRPDLVLVPGDTNSTLAGALAAAKLGIPVAHVEAGLRSFDPAMPEEINRRLTDAVSTLLFCPTRAAVANLRAEGVRRGVHRVGDVMLDAVRQHAAAARVRPLPAGLEPGGYYLATLHRQENTDDPARLRAILETLAGLERPVVLPLHPRTRVRLRQLRLRPGGAIRLLAPVPYLDSLRLLSGARAVLTDSGGMQKEAFILGTPCITLRSQTEWVETLEAGANRLAGADPSRIRASVRQLERAPRRVRGAARLYGGGRAAERIAVRIQRFLDA
jgi:UDP-N-acetylglucosamine 2-epimerase